MSARSVGSPPVITIESVLSPDALQQLNRLFRRQFVAEDIRLFLRAVNYSRDCILCVNVKRNRIRRHNLAPQYVPPPPFRK